MLNNITWQGYWTTLALLSAGYYLVIYALYYRKDFKMILPRKEQKSVHFSNTSSSAKGTFPEDVNEEFSSPTPGDEATIYTCMDELNAFFQESRKGKCVKEELIYAVQRILSKYPSIKDSEYKESINTVIQSEAKQHCSLQLSEGDMVHVWLER